MRAIRRFCFLCNFICISLLALSLASNANAADAAPLSDTSTQTKNSGAASPEEAATDMIRAMATRNFDLFVKTRLRHVCESESETPINRYAECLHQTRLVNGEKQLTIFELQFDRSPSVNILKKTRMHNFFTNHLGKDFTCVELEIEAYGGEKFRTLFVVGKYSEHWYAIPRSGSSQVYAIEDHKQSVESLLIERPSETNAKTQSK